MVSSGNWEKENLRQRVYPNRGRKVLLVADLEEICLQGEAGRDLAETTSLRSLFIIHWKFSTRANSLVSGLLPQNRIDFLSGETLKPT